VDGSLRRLQTDFLDILLLYASMGAHIIRLDAIAFLWKKVGTDCLHLPETHEVVRLMRDVLEMVAPQVLILTETNVPHEENISYFGDGDEAHLVYNFTLPPLLLHAIQNENAEHLAAWVETLGDPPAGCTFLNFTASHDGVGVRPLEGILPAEQIAGLAEKMKALGGHVSSRTRPESSTKSASSKPCTPKPSTTTRPSPTSRPASNSPADRAWDRGSATDSAANATTCRPSS